MAPADFETLRVARYERERDAEVRDVAEHLVRVVHAEREADDRRDRRKRDVALVERKADADDVRAVPFALADDAVVGDRGRVGACVRPGQREARHFAAVGEARQVMILLLLRSIVDEKLARAERVWNRDGRHERRRHAGHLLQHGRVRERREAEAAVFLRDDHPEEFLLLEEIPYLGRQIGAFVRDLPIVDHAAELFDRAVEECLLLDREHGFRLREQLGPVGFACEELAFEADGARFERDLLGVRKLWRDLAEYLEQRRADLPAPELDEVERQRDQRERNQRNDDCGRRRPGEPTARENRDDDADRPDAKADSEIGRSERNDERGENGYERTHDVTSSSSIVLRNCAT